MYKVIINKCIINNSAPHALFAHIVRVMRKYLISLNKVKLHQTHHHHNIPRSRTIDTSQECVLSTGTHTAFRFKRQTHT